MKSLLFTGACAMFALGITAGVMAAPNTAGGPTSNGASVSLNAFRGALLLDEATSTSRSVQMDALNWIDGLMKSHPAQAKSVSVYQALTDLALSGTRRPAISGSTVINSFPLIRTQAVRDIGTLGGSQALAPLLQVLRYDTDPVVLSEVAYELGKLGANPNNEVTNALAQSILHTPVRASDEIYAYNALAALTRLSGTSAAAAQAVYTEITTVREMGFQGPVRQEAKTILSGLMGVG